MNTKEKFHTGWTFAKTGPDASEYENLEFRPVQLPHDWLISSPILFLPGSRFDMAWFRFESQT